MTNESPVVPCCVVGTTVILFWTTTCQSVVPGGITDTLALFVALVKAPVIKTDCPGPVSLEIQKIVFEL